MVLWARQGFLLGCGVTTQPSFVRGLSVLAVVADGGHFLASNARGTDTEELSLQETLPRRRNTISCIRQLFYFFAVPIVVSGETYFNFDHEPNVHEECSVRFNNQHPRVGSTVSTNTFCCFLLCLCLTRKICVVGFQMRILTQETRTRLR